MPKKKIIGQSKLKKAMSPEDSTNDLRLLSPVRVSMKPTSFRLTPEDKERLRGLAISVNDMSPNKKISETMIIRALLFNGQKMKPERLIRAIREVIL